MSTLDELRLRIRGLDAEILHLVAARLETAREIGAIKRQSGVPLRDWAVERQVLDGAAASAAQIGVPDALARTILHTLIEAARAEQEWLHYSGYSGPAERIAIVGGAGRMGRWLADFLGNQGHNVRVYDTGAQADGEDVCRTLAEALNGASVAFVATPLDVVAESIREISRGGFDGVVCDIASLKGPVRNAVSEARRAGACVASIHPMFGPGTRTLCDQVIAFCDCGDAEATARVRGFFSDTAATLVDLSLEEHDRIMSYVLGLSHLVNLLFAGTLAASGRTFEQVQRVGSTTFHAQMATAQTVVGDNPELYYAIQRLNPFTPVLYDTLRRELDALTESVQDGDCKAFIERMHGGRRWVQGAPT